MRQGPLPDHLRPALLRQGLSGLDLSPIDSPSSRLVLVGAASALDQRASNFRCIVLSSTCDGRLPSSLALQGLPSNLNLHLLNKLSGALQGVGNGQVLRHHVLPRGASYLIRQIVASTNDAFGQATADAPAATA